jgi:integrase
LFSPEASVAARNVDRRRERKTPLTPSQRARRPLANPKRAPRDRYDKDTYARAIRRACEKAGINIWTPNRLRHSFATRVRQHPAGGLDTSQVLLNHRRIQTTQVYAEPNVAAASRLIKEIG